MLIEKILRNQAKCRNCETTITSWHRHDFAPCKCFKNEEGNLGIFVDGGNAYLRRGGKLSNIIELSETIKVESDEDQEC